MIHAVRQSSFSTTALASARNQAQIGRATQGRLGELADMFSKRLRGGTGAVSDANDGDSPAQRAAEHGGIGATLGQGAFGQSQTQVLLDRTYQVLRTTSATGAGL